jgi:hypothetical protein
MAEIRLPVVTSRSELLGLLTEACELEHGLLCSYLYSAFTIKQDLAEGDLTWQQLQMVRKWAAQIYFVASQEMLHLSQAWNLLAAIGGTPYYLRPNFPQGSKYYPLNLPLKLERFGVSSIRRFVFYERPLGVAPDMYFAKELDLAEADGSLPSYRTVGELYSIILSGFMNIPEAQLFIGAPERQVGRELVDFPTIVKVVDRATAKAAIDEITEQGEGLATDRQDSHFGMFKNILHDLEVERAKSEEVGLVFEPARACLENPVARYRSDYGAPKGTLIEDPYTQEVAELFDSIYGLMLRTLAYVFSNSTGDMTTLIDFSRLSIIVMPTVLKPLGEALTLMNAGGRHAGKTAGPSFAMSRHVLLQADPSTARAVVRERLSELSAAAIELAARDGAPDQLVRSSENLRSLGIGG